MGLTISYRLGTSAGDDEARALLRQLWAYARKLPFLRVTELIEMRDPARPKEAFGGSENPEDLAIARLLVQATRFVPKTGTDEEAEDPDAESAGAEDNEPAAAQARFVSASDCVEVAPTHLMAFRCHPAEGSEPANFGLCRYPPRVKAMVDGREVELETGLGGRFAWQSFCKTQYASNPEAGGVPNFLRAHTLIVRVLDRANELGLLEAVYDDSKYWDDRDPDRLADTIARWNGMVAAAVGRLNDVLERAGMTRGEAPITDYPDFEHLEAEGQRQARPEVRDEGPDDSDQTGEGPQPESRS